MRKLYYLLGLLLVSLAGYGQRTSELKITTSKVYGDSFDMWPKSTSKEDAIIVDWGDGERKSYNIDPNASGYFSKVSGKIVGDTIRIFTQLTALDCSDGQVTSLTCIDQPLLANLNARDNELTADYLDLSGALNLETIELSANQLTRMDMRPFEKLKFFTASDNENLATVLFHDGSEALEQITMSNCDISHFYPIELPNLTSLLLGNNALTDLEIDSHYPNLSALNISDNEYIMEINVSQCSKLTELNCSNNMISELNTSHCPELISLYCSDNRLTELNLSNNAKLTRVSCAKNQLTELNVSMLPLLMDLTCNGNQLSRIDVSKNEFLKNMICSDNLFEFLDFTNNSRLSKVDCRNNANMTACTVNYMFSTLWALSRDVYSANLLVEGCNAEHADASMVTSSDYKWKTDITCDGTAVCDSVVINLMPAENGTYKLEQPTAFGQKYKEITTKAMVGTPVKVVATPAEDYAYHSVSVNEVTVKDTLFCVKETSTIQVNFKSTIVPYILVDVKSNTDMSFALETPEDDTEVLIDWGDGVQKSYTVNSKETRIDGNSKANYVKITGPVVSANFESYPGIGIWDNELQGVDVTHNPNLTYLSLYMNPVRSLDVSKCPDLYYLDCSYCELDELNVTHNAKLESLLCFGNNLSTLDVRENPLLYELNARNNKLPALDLIANPLIEDLDVQNNALTSLVVTGMKNLVTLYASNNQLHVLDISENGQLQILNVSGNKLSELDLSHNLLLVKLYCGHNNIRHLDLSSHPAICYIDCSSNGMTACDLNDLYYSLPEYPTLEKPLKEIYTLVVNDNDADNQNAPDHAESILANAKGWKINYEGDGSGCDEAYITIKDTENGTVKVQDANKQEILSGHKVAKNSVLDVIATPAAGYVIESMKANGAAIVNNQFTVTRATDVVVKFTFGTGISDVNEESVTVRSGRDAIFVESTVNALITVYDMNGKQLYSREIAGKETIHLPAGTYIVTASNNGEKISKKVTVL